MRAIITRIWLDTGEGPVGVHLEVVSLGEVTNEELRTIQEVIESDNRKLLDLSVRPVDWTKP